MAANFKAFLNKYREKIGSNSIAESRYAKINNWISTGALALNRIISGSIKKGIPSGRIIILGGENSTGKSLLAATIMANAQKDGCTHIFYFDAEGGALKGFFENAGCNPEGIEQILVESVEDAQLKILDTYNMIQEYKEKDPDAKFFCVLDSLGALVPAKLMRDAEKEKVTSEMGGRAKVVNNMMKAITIPALKADTSMLVINHVYDNPGAMFTSKIKEQGGGKGLQYMASIIVQCSRALEKSEDKEGDGSFYGGTKLRFFTVKNRICRPSLECEIYLDFKKGFTKPFSALWDEAIRGGFILNPKQGYYTVPSWSDPERCFRQSQLENNVEVWKTFLPKFEEWSEQDLKYSKLAKDAFAAQEEAEREIQAEIDSGNVDDIDDMSAIEDTK